MALNLARPVDYRQQSVDFSPLANIGLAYAGQQQRQQQQEQQQQLVAQAQEIAGVGDVNAMRDFAIANPELGKTMFEFGGIADEQAQNRMSSLTKSLVSSATPVQDLKAYIEQGRQAGRDMTHSEKLLQQSGGDPEKLKQMTEMSLAVQDPKASKELQSLKPKAPEAMTAYQAEMVASKKIDQDLRREEATLKREENKLKRETDELKRDEIKLKIKESKNKINQSSTAKIQESEDAILKLDDTTNTIDRLLEGDALESAAGWQANFPTISGSKASDFEAMLDTLQSQAFLSQVSQMKGMGALSENEGKKLGQAIGSLSIDMSDEKLRSELLRIKETLEIAKIKAKNRMPKAQPQPESQSGSLSDEDLLKKYGG